MARQFVRKTPFGKLDVKTQLDLPLDFGTWDEPEFTALLEDGLSPQQAAQKLNQDLPFEKLKYKPNQYKNALDAANAAAVPLYNRNAARRFWENYGDFVTDDAYEDWAAKNGKQLQPKVNDSYRDQYLNDEDWLKSTWADNHQDMTDYYSRQDYEPKETIDADYERSYGPVDTLEKYDNYLKWMGGK